MSGMAPDPAPNVELELAKLANSAMAAGADPHLTTARLHRVLTYLRQNPELAAQATNALADGVATPADISQKVWQTLHADPNENPTAPTPTAPGVQMAPEEPGDQGPAPGHMPTFKQAGVHALTELANAAQGIPGVRAAEAYVRSKARGQTYREALDDIDSATQSLPTSHRIIGQMIGAAPLALMGGSPALTGALIGGADEALDADPDQSMTSRAVKTGVGALVGGATGRLTDMALTKLRANLNPTYAAERFGMGDEAKAANDQNYGAAIADAMTKQPTPQVKALLANPHFAERAASLKSLPQFEHMSTTDPRFLNELYQNLSDTEIGVRKGLQQLDPAKKNTKDAQLDAIGLLKQQLLAALETPGMKPPLTLNVAPETYTVDPHITPGHESFDGPPMPGPLNTYTAAQKPDIRQALRDLPNPSSGEMQGPGGPAFRLRAQPEIVRPGVEVSTPGMRIQTAPAEAMPPYMPGYRGAVDVARQAKAEERMFRTGYNALPANSTGGQLSERAAMNYSPEALERIANDPSKSASEKAKLVQGILASLKASPTLHGYGHVLGTPVPFFSRELRTAPGLIRAAGGQGVSDFLAKLGLLATQPAMNR